jgi:hypothetical protein
MSGIDLREALNWVLLESPLLFVYFAGVVWALLTWSRHPVVSLLATLGFALLAFTAILSPFLYQIVPALYAGSSSSGPYDMDWEEPGGSIIFKLVALMHSVLDAGAVLLLLFAIFSYRRPAEHWAPAVPPPSCGEFPAVDR